MRVSRLILLAGAAFHADRSIAADALKFGKPPEWVVPQVVPPANGKSASAPVSILLMDQQIRFEPGKTIAYAEVAMKLQTPEGLAAGNISLPWDPARDTVTVNKLQIRRGDQVIDVLASQTFTTIRRESNLELAMFDGVLTGNIQPEGLQQGDIIILATTTEHVDPVFGSHVEGNFMQWGASPIRLAHLHLDWPASLPLKLQAKGLSLTQTERAGRKIVELAQRDVEPIVPPKGAPPRFNITRLGEATDFASWADVANLAAPLYRKAETIPAAGPLHDEVEKIRTSTADPKLRAAKALQLVQDRVRYVALLMGQGGYVPADAETTWSRRFGDCKAKTALLLGILHSLGIEAEPIVIQSTIGDAIPERLPLMSYFDHVLVRAHIGGKTYFLDGTRTGDSDPDAIEVPNFDWGLPLVPDAKLVAMVPPPLQMPNLERHVDVDSSAGIYAPAAVVLTEVYRGDGAIELNNAYSALTAPQKDEVLRREAVQFFNGMQVGSSSLQFDKAGRKFTLLIKGTAKLDWNKGWFYVPTSSIGFNPDFARAAGSLLNAPVAVNHPRFVLDVAKIKLPPGFAAQQRLDQPVHETLAGVEYARTESVSADTITVQSSERSLVAEVPYKEALAAAARLKAINDDDTYLRMATAYRPTEKDVAGLTESEPGSAAEFVHRGNTLMDARKFDQAIADFTKALSLDPKDVTALADRAIAYVWTKKADLADKDLDAAAAIEPENAIVHRARALKAESAGDCTTAIEAYARSLRSEPRNSFAMGHRAFCEGLLGRHVEALSDAELALEIDPSWGELHALRLDSFARLGRKDDAAREADQLVKQSPQTASAAWITIGTIFAHAGLKNEAIAAFDKSLAIKPEPSTYVARAGIRPTSDFDGRMEDIEAALKLEPLDSDALAAKADLLAEQGDLKAALAIYDHALKTMPVLSPLSLGRGVLLYKLGRTGEAERLLNAWRHGAFTATELNQLCWKKATAGILLESALKDCGDALHINPNYVPALDSLAFVNLRLGKFKEAVNLYDRALVKAPLPSSYMGRALAYLHLGDSSNARSDRSEAIKRDAGIETRFAGYGLKFDESPAASTKAH